MTENAVADDPRSRDPAFFETAAQHACTSVPIVSRSATADEARSGLVGRSYESATHLVVLDQNRFLSLLRIEDLIAAPGHATMQELMDPDPPVVGPGVDQEIAAWRAVRRGESALAVVDETGRFRGLIPPPRLLEVLLAEHEEDLSRLGGFLKGTISARRTSLEPVPRRFWHRVPWLLVGLGGALVAAELVAWFQSELREMLVLAFFIPGIVYLADAVGTQTETVVVRGLAVGVSLHDVFARELVTGVAIGCALGLLSYPLVLWRWQQSELALAVGAAVFTACSVATLIAMLLPWVFSRIGLDPAFGSGPLATVIQDLLSLVIYFLVAASVLR